MLTVVGNQYASASLPHVIHLVLTEPPENCLSTHTLQAVQRTWLKSNEVAFLKAVLKFSSLYLQHSDIIMLFSICAIQMVK